MKLLVVGMSPLPIRYYQKLKAKYELTVSSLKKDIIFQVATQRYELVIIWSERLPYLSLKKTLGHLYGRFSDLKVLVCGACYSSPERAALLMLGVKDCVASTICPDELLAKVAIISQTAMEDELKTPFMAGDFVFDFMKNVASYGGINIVLNKKETLLLRTMLQRQNTLLSKQLLYDLIWDSVSVPTSNSLEVYISSLRRKIEKPFGLKLIETVKGVGYRVKGN